MKQSKISIRAIERMARRAAKEAEVRKTLQLPKQSKVFKKQPHKSHKSHKSVFEAQVKAFRKALASTMSAEAYVILSDNDSRIAGKATIKVYKVADLERQQVELEEYNAQLASGRDKSEIPKPFRAQVVVMYVLYPDTIAQDRLGSIAVYGDGASNRCAAINKSGAIFGFPVRYAKIEIGRRPFVDVYLKQNRA